MTATDHHPTSTAANPQQARPTVLVLDDNLLTLQYMDLLLRPHFTVVTTTSIDEACAVVRRQRIDFFVSDYHLGSDCTGAMALARLGGIPTFNPLACVLVTSDPSLEVARDALSAGFTQVFHKPLTNRFKLQCAAWGEVWQRSARG
jgi:CheY-like chemotaxis protein